MNREQVERQLEALRQQEATLQEQLLMTRGAVQVLEHLLNEDAAPVSDQKAEAEHGER